MKGSLATECDITSKLAIKPVPKQSFKVYVSTQHSISLELFNQG